MVNQIKYYLCKIHFRVTKGFKYILVLICLLSLRFQQPSSFDANAKIKAVFIYGFTRYFEWPDKKKEGAFVIYIVGKNDPLVSELKSLATTKKVGNQDIEIKNSPTYDASVPCNIIYFTANHELKQIGDAVNKSKNKGNLLISETEGACRSASINFKYIEGKLKFEYSKNAAVKAGLKTNEGFKALATEICD